jgi:hypothetical protein
MNAASDEIESDRNAWFKFKNPIEFFRPSDFVALDSP